jgi:hypothetical protein
MRGWAEAAAPRGLGPTRDASGPATAGAPGA